MASNILRAVEAIRTIQQLRTIRDIQNGNIKKDRRWWIRPSNLNRATEGFFETAYQLMRERDPEYFFRCTRMSSYTFDLLLSKIKHRLEKFSIRTPISPECRLFVTLVYLSGGSSIFYVSRIFRLGVTTVREITQEVTQVLWEELKHDYLPEVDGQQWQRYSAEFESRWNLPHCCAAVDGKHVTITCPPNSGSMYYNYKKQYSIVLMAMCDANYNFVGVDIGAYGGNADGSVFAQSAFGYRLLHGELELPQPSALPNGDVLPYFIVGDAAFPLKSNLMRPYPGRNLEILQENFNYRLSRARRTIENAFGVLVARWRILLSPLQLQPDAAENIVKASVVLHNFVKRHNANQYAPPSFVDHIGQEGEIIVPGEWRSQVDPLVGIDSDFVQRGNNAARNAYQARDVLAKYLLETRFR